MPRAADAGASDRASPEQARPSMRAWVAVAVLIVIFDVLKIAAIRYGTGDEFIYFHMGKLVADGKLPYRDFFFSHPPLRLVAPAVVFATAGFQFTALKLLPILVADVTAVLLFVHARRAVSPFVGVLAAGLFLFSTTGHTFGSYYMGQETTVALMAAGLVSLQCGRPLAGGVWLGLAMLCGVYAACAVVVAALAAARAGRTGLVRLLVGFGAAFALGTGVCLAFAGKDYWSQTVVFQTLKVEDPVAGKWPVVAEIAMLDPAIVVLAAVAPFRKGIGLLVAVAGAYVVAILAFANIHLVYAELCIPFLAVAAAAGLSSATERFRVPRLPPALVAGTIAAVLCVVGVLRSRTIAARSEQFSIADVARSVGELTDPGQSVFGDASVAPLVALLADREVVADYVDTTGMNYLTKAVELNSVVGRLGPDWTGVVVVRNTYLPQGPDEGINITKGPMVDPEFAAFIYAHFTSVRSFPRADDPREAILLFVRNERLSKAAGAK